MADGKKKMAAALAAVNAYLQEEEAVHQQSLSALPPPPQPVASGLWSHSGRQEMMSMRQLIQLKAFSRF